MIVLRIASASRPFPRSVCSCDAAGKPQVDHSVQKDSHTRQRNGGNDPPLSSSAPVRQAPTPLARRNPAASHGSKRAGTGHLRHRLVRLSQKAGVSNRRVSCCQSCFSWCFCLLAVGD